MINPEDYLEERCPLCMVDPSDKNKKAEKIPIVHIIDRLDKALTSGDYYEAFRILSYWIKEAQALGDEEGELTVQSEMMGLARKMQNREAGRTSVDRGVELVRKLGYDKSVSGATVLLNAGTTMKAFGQAEKSVPLYREAEKIYESNLKQGDSRFGGLWNNFALALADIGHYEEAETYFNKALSLMESLGTEGKTGVAVTAVNLADFYQAGDLSDKEIKIDFYLQKAWDALDCSDVPRDGEYAYVCEKCAPAFSFYGWFGAAQDLETRMREIHERN